MILNSGSHTSTYSVDCSCKQSHRVLLATLSTMPFSFSFFHFLKVKMEIPFWPLTACLTLRVSGSWVSKKRRQRYPPASGPELFSRAYVNRVDDDDDYDDEVVTRTTNRRSAVLQRGSRTKVLYTLEESPCCVPRQPLCL